MLSVIDVERKNAKSTSNVREERKNGRGNAIKEINQTFQRHQRRRARTSRILRPRILQTWLLKIPNIQERDQIANIKEFFRRHQSQHTLNPRILQHWRLQIPSMEELSVKTTRRLSVAWQRQKLTPLPNLTSQSAPIYPIMLSTIQTLLPAAKISPLFLQRQSPVVTPLLIKRPHQLQSIFMATCVCFSTFWISRENAV